MANPLRYAIVDLETTGGDPRRDRIIEVAVLLSDGQQELDRFESLVNPGMAIPWDITRITGIDNDMVRHAPPFHEIARRIVEITEGAVFVAHNVQFDYGFIQQSFRSLAYTFARKRLCTIRLARRLQPGLPSYGLANLCRHFGIVNARAHRAMGDVEATWELFRRLTAGGEDTAPFTLQADIAATKLPPRISAREVDELPEEAGVYYFMDEMGRPLYVGKSNDIRKRILSHFSASHKTQSGMRMIQQIAGITYTLTGSELIALLLENEEIKRWQPPFNRAQRKTMFKYGIFAQADTRGYLRLEVHELARRKDTPLSSYPAHGNAEGALLRRVSDFQLCASLCGLAHCRQHCLYHQMAHCLGAGVGAEAPEVYNERAEAAASYLVYGMPDFAIVTEGRHPDERAVVWVENGCYAGYGYFDPGSLNSDEPEALRNFVQPRKESPDVRQIIQGWIRRHPQELLQWKD